MAALFEDLPVMLGAATARPAQLSISGAPVHSAGSVAASMRMGA